MQPLIDISALASCFKEYGPHPLHYVYRLLQPIAPSAYNLLGNAVNTMFDVVVSAQGRKGAADDVSLNEVLQSSWHDDALHYLSADEEQLRRVYFNTVAEQYANVKKVVEQEFPRQHIDAAGAWLEPSFVCPSLGLSGRMDLLDLSSEGANIVELKSGKMNEWQGQPKLAHRVQTMLYAAILHRNMGYLPDQIHSFLHYNTYPLLEHQIFPEELYQSAFSLLDEIHAILHDIADGQGEKYFTRSAVLSMYPNQHVKLWTQYDCPQLLELVSPIEDASPELRSWFFSRLQFLLREEELKAEQPEAVSLRNLPLAGIDTDEHGEVRTLTFSQSHCSSLPDSDIPLPVEHDFRCGDPVILYQMRSSQTQASDGMILRGSVAALSEKEICIELRHAERSCHFLPLLAADQPFAVEHDTINSNLSQACRSLYSTLVQGGPALNNCRLIVGPPGTGKTSVTLRNLVTHLYHDTAQRVLLLAFTHRAVDEICETLDAAALPYVRLGTSTDTPAAYQPHLLQRIIDRCNRREELRQQLADQRFYVGTTARLQAMPQLFDLLSFDTLIVDEASQLLDHQVIGILKQAKQEIVLIGDPKQLPAVMLQEGAQSLFEQLYRQYQAQGITDRIVLLDKQGRMHPDIAAFSNKLFYGNRLSSVGLPHQLEKEALMPRYAFIDVPSPQLGTKSNPAEARMVARLVARVADVYRSHQLPWTEKTLGIIVPYRQQIAAIRTMLHDELPVTDASLSALINIDTVERYQGSQRDVIIFTTTVSTPEQLALLSTPIMLDGQLIDRKLNVAITRARKHLFIVGNKQLLSQNPLYCQLCMNKV